MSELPETPGKHAFRRHLWPLLRNYRWSILAAIVLVGISGIAVTVQNVYPKWLFSQVLEPENLPAAERWQRLAWLVAGYLIVTVFLRMITWHTGFRLFTRVREKVILALRAQFFRHVNNLCVRFHGQHHSGELFSYLFGSPLANVMQFFQHTSMMTPSAIVSLVATLALFWKWDHPIAICLFLMCGLSIWMMFHAKNRVRILNREYQKTEGNVSGQAADLLRGNKAVKLHSMENQVASEFETQAGMLGRKSYERDVRSHVEWMKQETLSYFGYALLLGVSTWRYLHGHVDLGTVAACLTAYGGLHMPLQGIYQTLTLWGGAAASLERIGTVLDTASTTPDPEIAAQALPGPAAIEFANVSFRYEEKGKPLIQQLDLKIPYGQHLALVGPSGAGKSTLLQLILRLYDPAEGAVKIGDTDIRELYSRDLRRLFGVVPQDPFIFTTTLRDNLRIARPDADDAALEAACRKANAWEFIAALPEGLDTRVGESGATLSGGQRQRLAIARAFLANPPYYVFDEATSALDTLSEQLIQDAIEKNLQGRTALFVAHRLSTVKNCHRILVLSGGKVVQDGTYAELVAQPGVFRELVEGQQLHG